MLERPNFDEVSQLIVVGKQLLFNNIAITNYLQ